MAAILVNGCEDFFCDLLDELLFALPFGFLVDVALFVFAGLFLFARLFRFIALGGVAVAFDGGFEFIPNLFVGVDCSGHGTVVDGRRVSCLATDGARPIREPFWGYSDVVVVAVAAAATVGALGIVSLGE